jgi:hypothetical protein
MLAFVFWHWPRPEVERAEYEAGLAEFHDTLRRNPPEGFLHSAAFRGGSCSWGSASGPTYEDWYLTRGTEGLDPLEHGAVHGACQPPHDRVAKLAAGGCAGLYRLRAGTIELPRVRHSLWLAKPDGALAASARVGAGTQGSSKPAAAPSSVKLPPAIEATFKQKWPNAVAKHISKETEDGKTIYEVESIDAGRRRDINFAPDGTIVLYEEELKASEVPAVVLDAVAKRYPKAKITLWERLYTIKDNSANYELGISGVHGVDEVILTPDGTWVSPKPGK